MLPCHITIRNREKDHYTSTIQFSSRLAKAQARDKFMPLVMGEIIQVRARDRSRHFFLLRPRLFCLRGAFFSMAAQRDKKTVQDKGVSFRELMRAINVLRRAMPGTVFVPSRVSSSPIRRNAEIIVSPLLT